jgi:hypothetical protein
MPSYSNNDLIYFLRQSWRQEQLCHGCKLWNCYEQLDNLWYQINLALHDPKNIDHWAFLDNQKREIEIRLSQISQEFDESFNDEYC